MDLRQMTFADLPFFTEEVSEVIEVINNESLKGRYSMVLEDGTDIIALLVENTSSVVQVKENKVIEPIELMCSFTGHRPQYFHFKYNEAHADCIKLKAVLKEQIIRALELGYRKFMSGMALGIDQWAVEILLELKEEYEDIYIVGAIPCKNQDKMWIESGKKRYRGLLSKIDEAIYVSEEEYHNGCMEKRDEFMVSKSTMQIAVYNGVKSGTEKTYKLALAKGLMVLCLNPTDLTVKEHNLKVA